MNNIFKSQVACLCIIRSSSVLSGEGKHYFSLQRKELWNTIKTVRNQAKETGDPDKQKIIIGQDTYNIFSAPNENGLDTFGTRTGKLNDPTQSIEIIESKQKSEQKSEQKSPQIKLMIGDEQQIINGPKDMWKNRKFPKQLLDIFFQDSHEDFERHLETMKNPNASTEQKQYAMQQLSMFFTSPKLPKKDKKKIKQLVRSSNLELGVKAHATYFNMNPEEIEKLRNTLLPLHVCPSIVNDTSPFIPEDMEEILLTPGLTLYKSQDKKPTQPDYAVLTKEFFPPERWLEVTDSNGTVLNLDGDLEILTANFKGTTQGTTLTLLKKRTKLEQLLGKVQKLLRRIKGSEVRELIDIYNSFPGSGAAFENPAVEPMAAVQMGAKIPLFIKEYQNLSEKTENELEKLK
jgi:hypothetical protein